MITGHWAWVIHCLHSSLITSSPLFSVITNSSKGSGKRVKNIPSAVGPVSIYTHETALVKQRARELVIPCNSRPCHNQYCIIQVHCLSLKVILSPKELFHSINLFSFLFFSKEKRNALWKAKEVSENSITFRLLVSGRPDILKSQLSEACIRIQPALQSSCSCLFSCNPQLEILYSKQKISKQLEILYSKQQTKKSSKQQPQLYHWQFLRAKIPGLQQSMVNILEEPWCTQAKNDPIAPRCSTWAAPR